MINSGSQPCSLGSPNATVGFEEFNCGPTDVGQCFAEQRTQKHVRVSCVNLVDFHPHFLHDFHPIAKAKNDAFLGCPQQVSLRMFVKIQSMHRATHSLILKHTFGPVTKGDNSHAITSDRDFFRHFVHFCIAHIGGDIPMHPGVQNPSSIDTQQHTETIFRCCIVGMSKGVNAALCIIVHFAQNSINHPRSARRTGYFSRIKHV